MTKNHFMTLLKNLLNIKIFHSSVSELIFIALHDLTSFCSYTTKDKRTYLFKELLYVQGTNCQWKDVSDDWKFMKMAIVNVLLKQKRSVWDFTSWDMFQFSLYQYVHKI
jgi:hypothetical protein